MALVYADRIKETSTTTGTGTYNLAGAVTGFQTFVAGIATGNTCYYCATDDTNWEVGLGTVTDATPDTLARTAILASSNGGAAVNWAAGTRNIFSTIPAAVVSGAGGYVYVTKTANQTSTSTTYANDNTLAFAVAASTKYKFRFRLIINTPAAADFKVQLTGPAAPTAVRYHATYIAENNLAVIGPTAVATAFSTSLAFATAEIGLGVDISGYLDNGANAGTVTLQWAQVTASGTSTVFMGSEVSYAVI